MGRKSRSSKKADPGDAAAFKVNPFAGLHVDVPAASEEPSPQTEKPKAKTSGKPPAPLTGADADLLKVFSEVNPGAHVGGRAPLVTLRLERRSRGKHVTCVSGLEGMDPLDHMELARELRQRLGIGARFCEGILELQGDQRTRASDWFQSQGYAVSMPS